MVVCPSCNGFGTWEWWGRYETCPVCEGTGEVDDEPEEWGLPGSEEEKEEQEVQHASS